MLCHTNIWEIQGPLADPTAINPNVAHVAAGTFSPVPVFLAASLRQFAALATAHHNRHAPEQLQSGQ